MIKKKVPGSEGNIAWQKGMLSHDLLQVVECICPASMSKTVVRLLHFRGTNYIADIASPPLPVL